MWRCYDARAVGALDQPGFEAIVNAGCPACGAATLDISSFIDRSIALMLGDPTNAGRWVHDGEKFVDGTYEIRCAACKHVAFAADICPRCNAAGGLARAIGDDSRLVAPKRCTKCNELEMLAIALVAARARRGETPKPLADFGEPGYHLVAYACDGCSNAVVADGCPLCAAPGPLRARP
jgi:hypothetical protein